MSSWLHAAPSVLAAFLASGVEFVEALTVVLAVGAVRGWRGALAGAGAALALLTVLVAVAGPALTRVPLDVMQVVVGTLLLLFGLRWLRKAILRAACAIPLHDEAMVFAAEIQRLRAVAGRRAWDAAGFAASFQITLLEGVEVAFIVVAIGAGNAALFGPVIAAAAAALIATAALGVALHRPLTRIPENALKFVVGVVLSGFGTFWLAEGLDMPWPGGDWALPALCLGFLLTAAATLRLARFRPAGAKATA
jgi:uncharacterized membrane protein